MKGEEEKARWEKYTEEQRVVKLWFSQAIKKQVWTSRKSQSSLSWRGNPVGRNEKLEDKEGGFSLLKDMEIG